MVLENVDFLNMHCHLLDSSFELPAAGVSGAYILAVDHIEDQNYIKQVAEHIYEGGCRNVLLCGNNAELWHNIFDKVYVDLYETEIQDEDCNGTLTVAYENVVQCADELYDLLANYEMSGGKVGLLYDDDNLYRDLVEKTKWLKMQPDIFHVVKCHLEEIEAKGVLPDISPDSLNLLSERIAGQIMPDCSVDDIVVLMCRELCSNKDALSAIEASAEVIYQWLKNVK